MKTSIQIQETREISGIGIVLQFNVTEGVVKPGMTFEVNGTDFTITDKMTRYADPATAERALWLRSKETDTYEQVSEAKPSNSIFQAVLESTVSGEEALKLLSSSKTGIFDLEE